MQYQAPVAQMTRKSSKVNSTQDFQAQADRLDELRDAEDSDYHQSVTTPRKRRAPNDDNPRSSKKKSPRHQPYDMLKTDSQKERRAFVSTIRKNWRGDVGNWMPKSMWPCRAIRLSDNRNSRLLIEDPRDWNAPLLEELSYLSNLTKNQPAVALKALEEAVMRRQQDDNDHTETQVLKEDVRMAMQLCNLAGPSRTTPALTEEGIGDAEPADVEMPQDEAEPDPAALRSPTFAAEEPVVTGERQTLDMRNVTENAIGGVWTSFDDDIEKLKVAVLEQEELEATAAAKRKQREVIELRRRIRKQLQEHGDTKQDATLLRPE
jgi:hypothetical protein